MKGMIEYLPQLVVFLIENCLSDRKVYAETCLPSVVMGNRKETIMSHLMFLRALYTTQDLKTLFDLQHAYIYIVSLSSSFFPHAY